MKIMNRFIASSMIIIVVISIIILGYNFNKPSFQPAQSTTPSPAVLNTGYDRVGYTYEETIEKCTHIVVATFKGTTKTDGLDEIMFSVEEQVKGNISDSLIYVQDSYKLNVDYVIGNTYVLFLDRNTSLYYTHDRYVALEILPRVEADIDYIRDILKESKDKAPEKYGYDYTESTDIKNIMDSSANIFEVEVIDVYVKSKYASTTVYNCKVLKTLRNEPENADILIVFFNGTVEVGNKYIVLLADTQGPSKIYALSSKNSVYSLEEAENISELSKIMATAQDYTNKYETNDETIYKAEQEYKAAQAKKR